MEVSVRDREEISEERKQINTALREEERRRRADAKALLEAELRARVAAEAKDLAVMRFGGAAGYHVSGSGGRAGKTGAESEAEVERAGEGDGRANSRSLWSQTRERVSVFTVNCK